MLVCICLVWVDLRTVLLHVLLLLSWLRELLLHLVWRHNLRMGARRWPSLLLLRLLVLLLLLLLVLLMLLMLMLLLHRGRHLEVLGRLLWLLVTLHVELRSGLLLRDLSTFDLYLRLFFDRRLVRNTWL